MASKDKLHLAGTGAHEARKVMGAQGFYEYLRRDLRIGEPLAKRLSYTSPIPVKDAPNSAINAFAGLVGISRRGRS